MYLYVEIYNGNCGWKTPISGKSMFGVDPNKSMQWFTFARSLQVIIYDRLFVWMQLRMRACCYMLWVASVHVVNLRWNEHCHRKWRACVTIRHAFITPVLRQNEQKRWALSVIWEKQHTNNRERSVSGQFQVRGDWTPRPLVALSSKCSRLNWNTTVNFKKKDNTATWACFLSPSPFLPFFSNSGRQAELHQCCLQLLIIPTGRLSLHCCTFSQCFPQWNKAQIRLLPGTVLTPNA